MQLWFRKQLRGHACQITLALVKNIYIYTTRFPGCLLFQSRALCPQSVSSGLYVGGFGFFCNLCSFKSCTAKGQTLVALHVPHRQRTVTAPWPWSLREAGSLGSDERHFQGPALVLQIPSGSAGCTRNSFSMLRAGAFLMLLQGEPLAKGFPSTCWGVCSPTHMVGGLAADIYPLRWELMARKPSQGLDGGCSEITQSLVFAALLP